MKRASTTSKPSAGAKSSAGAKPSSSAKPAAARGPAKPAKSAKPAKPVARPAKLAHGPAPRPARGSVSRTSAQRFAARVRARRRRRRLIIALAFLVFFGGGWAALRSPWATVGRIEVSGTDRIPPGAIEAAAAPELGQPMLFARTTSLIAAVRQQRLIRSVRVRRHWPSTLQITVVERQPVAAVPAVAQPNQPSQANQPDQFDLVDPDGVLIERVSSGLIPAGLPRIEVNPAVAGAGAVDGCLAVLHSLPKELARRMTSIGADSPDGIWLKLADGSRVEWGNSSDNPLKARVLIALLPQHAVDYDVRSPQTPAVRGK